MSKSKLKPLSDLRCMGCAHFYPFKKNLFPTVRAFCRKHRIYFKAENEHDQSNCENFQPLPESHEVAKK